MKKILRFRNQIAPKSITLLLACCLFLVACSNGDGTSGSGNQMGASTSFEQDLRGVAQKGMFLAGTTVTAWQLGENGQRTGTTLSTVMEGSQGFYDLALSWSGWTEVEVQGRYFDEFTGTESIEPITLSEAGYFTLVVGLLIQSIVSYL